MFFILHVAASTRYCNVPSASWIATDCSLFTRINYTMRPHATYSHSLGMIWYSTISVNHPDMAVVRQMCGSPAAPHPVLFPRLSCFITNLCPALFAKGETAPVSLMRLFFGHRVPRSIELPPGTHITCLEFVGPLSHRVLHSTFQTSAMRRLLRITEASSFICMGQPRDFYWQVSAPTITYPSWGLGFCWFFLPVAGHNK